MKKHIFFLGFLLVGSMLLSQNNGTDDHMSRRWSGHLSIGASVLNPNHSLKSAFDKNGFADTQDGWLADTEYPEKYAWPSLEMEFGYLIKSHQEIGGAFMASTGEIAGYDESFDQKLDIVNINFRLTPFYKYYGPSYKSYFQTGISLNIGELYRTEITDQVIPYTDRYIRFGLMAGTGFSLMEKKNSFLRIGLNYHISPVKLDIGPFENVNNPDLSPKDQVIYEIFPNEEILLQELIIKAVYGFRFRTD